MIPISEAISIVARETQLLEAERVALGECVGRILAEDIVADLDLPPFDRSQMDGFAVRAAEATEGTRLRIIGESVAGKGFDGDLGTGEAVRIMTGARVPAGADAVQKIEETRESTGTVEIRKAVTAGQNIVGRAREIRIGDTLFRAGARINERMIASLASFGYSDVAVSAAPRASILATGSEIVDIDRVPGPDQIRNSNSAMLSAFAAADGIRHRVEPIVGDDLGNLTAAISEMLSSQPEIIVLTGGVSVGDYDFTKTAFRDAGVEIFFDKIALKPGKPTVFGRSGRTLVFGLPGNPVSVAVTYFLFVRFAALLMQNAADPEMRRGNAVAMHEIRSTPKRDCYLPVSLATDDSGRLIIDSLRFTGSSDFIAFSAADALLYVQKGTTIAPGEVAEVCFLER